MQGLSTGSAAVATAVAVILVAAMTALVAPTALADTDHDLSFEPDVPEDYDFESARSDGVATIDGQRYDTLSGALAAADPGETVHLRGRFDPDRSVEVTTSNLTLRGAGRYPVIDGTGEGDVLVLNATNVTVDHVWVRNSGYAASKNDAAIWVESDGVTVRDSRVTNMTFGIWVNGASDVRLVNNVIDGREQIHPLTKRGNGIQLWKTRETLVAGNRITDVRDGIYYSWSEGVLARNNTMWSIRYGVHYMYSDDCTLLNNTSFRNDVGYALMVSQNLRILNNTAVNNSGQSGHGIMLKSIDHTTVRGNHLVANQKGVFLYNSLNNTITWNLVVGNDVGIHVSAGSVRERVHHNTFVRNGMPVRADIGAQVAWNASDIGNYWSRAGTVDIDDDGVSETRYRPAGMVQQLRTEHPETAVFVRSPAFEVIRLAESTLPVIESRGVVDYHPLVEPQHDWRKYYESYRRS